MAHACDAHNDVVRSIFLLIFSIHMFVLGVHKELVESWNLIGQFGSDGAIGPVL